MEKEKLDEVVKKSLVVALFLFLLRSNFSSRTLSLFYVSITMREREILKKFP